MQFKICNCDHCLQIIDTEKLLKSRNLSEIPGEESYLFRKMKANKVIRALSVLEKIFKMNRFPGTLRVNEEKQKA